MVIIILSVEGVLSMQMDFILEFLFQNVYALLVLLFVITFSLFWLPLILRKKM